MAEKLQKARDLAPLFGIKPDTIYKWRRRGKLRGYTVDDSRLLRFKESEVRKCFETAKN